MQQTNGRRVWSDVESRGAGGTCFVPSGPGRGAGGLLDVEKSGGERCAAGQRKGKGYIDDRDEGLRHEHGRARQASRGICTSGLRAALLTEAPTSKAAAWTVRADGTRSSTHDGHTYIQTLQHRAAELHHSTVPTCPARACYRALLVSRLSSLRPARASTQHLP